MPLHSLNCGAGMARVSQEQVKANKRRADFFNAGVAARRKIDAQEKAIRPFEDATDNMRESWVPYRSIRPEPFNKP